MAGNDELFDLSLFAESPGYDRHFSIPLAPRQQYPDEVPPQFREFAPALPRDYSNKPLPPLPQRRICTMPKASASRGGEMDSRCILKRIKRVGSNEHSSGQRDTLLRRRNPHSPPQLTLSVPQSHPWNRHPASAMVWMPDEQMWLIAGEVQREITNQTAYPSPPSYTPRAFTQSEPSPTVSPSFDLTPPMTPVQHQLQSLILPPIDRDEEGLSPLFQEAMNSVPMMDPGELFLPPFPPLYTTSSAFEQNLRPYTALPSPVPDVVSPQSSRGRRSTGSVRSVLAGSRDSQLRSDTSDTTRSYHSAMSFDLSPPANSASRWVGVARRVAKSNSATD